MTDDAVTFGLGDDVRVGPINENSCIENNHFAQPAGITITIRSHLADEPTIVRNAVIEASAAPLAAERDRLAAENERLRQDHAGRDSTDRWVDRASQADGIIIKRLREALAEALDIGKAFGDSLFDRSYDVNLMASRFERIAELRKLVGG